MSYGTLKLVLTRHFTECPHITENMTFPAVVTGIGFMAHGTMTPECEGFYNRHPIEDETLFVVKKEEFEKVGGRICGDDLTLGHGSMGVYRMCDYDNPFFYWNRLKRSREVGMMP